MSKKRELTDERVKAWRKALPAADRRFFRALLTIGQIVGDPSLHYAEPSAGLRRALQRADRNTLFSIIAECLYMLLDAPAMKVVKRFHRRRKRAACGQERRQQRGETGTQAQGRVGKARKPAG
jgi:hypothetical protein